MILTIALTLCYKTPGFLYLIFAVLLQTERTKYANGVDSKIDVQTKFEVSVFMRCTVIQRVQKIKSRSRGCVRCVLFYVHSNFTLLAKYFLLSICAPNLKLVGTAVAWIEEVKM